MLIMNKVTKTVTTFDGKELPRNSCIRFMIKGVYLYYEKNVTCFKIKNQNNDIKRGKDWHWARIDNGLISYNVDDQCWDLNVILNKNNNFIKGIYTTNMDIGYFTPNIHTTVYIKNELNSNNFIPCLNSKIAESLGYIDINYDGFYYKVENISKKDLINIKKNKTKTNYKFDESIKKSSNAYGADEKNIGYINILKHYNSNNNNFIINIEDHYLSSFINNFTFGAEFETSTGFIPEKYCYKYGLLPLRDGSINGYEYTTIPLHGSKGISSLRNICKILTKRTNIDINCSFHLHIGGYERNAESIVALYKLIYQIQNDLFLMVPPYQRDKVKYLGFSKNYCKKLPSLNLTSENNDINLNEIFRFLTSSENEDHTINWNSCFNIDNNNNLNSYIHPLDISSNSKWNIKARYYLINFIPFIFSRKHTVEFRLHTPTTNYTKVINWLLICSAILKFAKIYREDILANKNFNIYDVLDIYSIKNNIEGVQLAEYLKKYYDNRKNYFAKLLEEKDDIYGNEISNDKTYTFTNNSRISNYINSK